MEKMRGVKPKNNTPALVAGNSDVVAAARKTRKRGGKMMSEKMEGEKHMKRADRACRSTGGALAGGDWAAAQGPGKKPGR